MTKWTRETVLARLSECRDGVMKAFGAVADDAYYSAPCTGKRYDYAGGQHIFDSELDAIAAALNAAAPDVGRMLGGVAESLNDAPNGQVMRHVNRVATGHEMKPNPLLSLPAQMREAEKQWQATTQWATLTTDGYRQCERLRAFIGDCEAMLRPALYPPPDEAVAPGSTARTLAHYADAKPVDPYRQHDHKAIIRAVDASRELRGLKPGPQYPAGSYVGGGLAENELYGAREHLAKAQAAVAELERAIAEHGRGAGK